MYYPKQIPYLLDKDFQEYIQYQEYQLPKLSDFCMCIWQMQSKKIAAKTIYNYILPDACIDIVIDFTDKSICFAGFSKETIPFALDKQIDYMGVRLKPSAFYLLYGISADKIMDHPLPFAAVDQQHQLTELFTTADSTERLHILKDYLLKISSKKTPRRSITLIDELYQNPKEQTVNAIAEGCGYHERHFYRLCKVYYGLSPKVLLNILRLHLCLTMMLEGNSDLSDIAHSCGFYDQAHFIKEIKRYTGFSPLQLLARYR